MTKKTNKQESVFVRLKLVGEAHQLVLDEKKKFTIRNLTISKDTIINNLLIEEYRKRNPLKQDLI